MPIKFSQLEKVESVENSDIFPIVRSDSPPYNYSVKGEDIVDFINDQNNLKAAINKILTAENAAQTNINLIDSIDNPSAFYRPNSLYFPNKRGWLDGISNVVLSGDNLIENQDFVFFDDRQIFYFLDPETSGKISFDGYVRYNSVVYTIQGEKNVESSPFAPVNFNIQSVDSVELIKNNKNTGETLVEQFENFYFDKDSKLIILKSDFTFKAAEVNLVSFSNVIFKINYLGSGEFITRSSLDIPNEWWKSVQVKVNGQLLSTNSYSFSANSLVLRDGLSGDVLNITGTTNLSNVILEYDIDNANGKVFSVPVGVKSTLDIKLKNVDFGFGEGNTWDEWTALVTFIEKGAAGQSNAIALGQSLSPSIVKVKCIDEDGSIYYIHADSGDENTPCSISLPNYYDDIISLRIENSKVPIVFDYKNQKLFFTKKISGSFYYSAVHHAYEGLSRGGETIEVLSEITGLMATTCGTGQYLHTQSTIDPITNWNNWMKENYGKDNVIITNSKSIIVYQDYREDAGKRTKIGLTQDSIKPLTLKLPFAPVFQESRMDDTCLFQVAIQIGDKLQPFESSTYLELEDSKRSAEILKSSILQLSNDITTAVRGVRGINITGPKPTYYVDSVVPKMLISTYKWFVVLCKNTNGNSKLEQNKKYLLCINNVNYDDSSIKCQVTDDDYYTSCDLFPFLQ